MICTTRTLCTFALFMAALCADAQEPDGRTRPVRRLPAIDCTNVNGLCPEITIVGDAPATLPGGTTSPVGGFADPTIRRDPSTTRIWMAYSWPFLSFPEGGDATVTVDNHLAHSDDSGETWVFDSVLWRSAAAIDPSSGTSGYINSEVVTLAPQKLSDRVVWHSARSNYFTAFGNDPKLNSFTLRIASAESPLHLPASEEAILGGGRTASGWNVDTNLAALSTEVDRCTWNDPALLMHGDALYLATQCMLFTPTGEEDVDREFVALFATQPVGSVKSWVWRYVGKLGERADALELGGDVLMQTDLAIGRDGAVIAIYSPSGPGGKLADHFGCRAVEVESLDPPRLARQPSGRLRVRASVTASDLAPEGPGACGYDAASSTGIVIVRRELDPGRLIVSLRRTGLRP